MSSLLFPASVPQLVMFHGCYHDASGSWPYDPVHCPECLGLPEEVAHTKQVGKPGHCQTACHLPAHTLL